MSKISHIFLLFMLCMYIHLQAQFTDDFTDGDFTNNPTWSGDDSVFVVVPENGNNMLRSNKQIASTSFYLSTPSTQVNDCQWEFFVNLKFNTSSTNFVDVFLISNQANLLQPGISGYFVRIGNTQDEISLYRKDAGVNVKIIDGTDGVTNFSNNVLKIKVVRSQTNVWNLERDVTGTGNSYVSEGTVTDAIYLSSSFFGVAITQSTASFFNKHFFDDFYAGPIIYDLTPPVLASAVPISATELDVLFDEIVEQSTAETASNYSVNNGIGIPLTALRDNVNHKLVHLTFGNSFSSGQLYTLTVNNVEDLSSNPIANGTISFTFYQLSLPSFREVVINEIFPDPSPQVGLPEKEFIELFNASNKHFNLSGWKFSDGSSTGTLSNYIFPAGEHLILCKMSDTAFFKFFGPVMGLSTWPTLNNSGDNLSLHDNVNNLLDNVEYSDSWYGDPVKKNGGWTLELINPYTPCTGSNNWKASVNPQGGTPAAQNSLYSTAPDTVKPNLISISPVSLSQIDCFFDKTMDSLSLANAIYTISQGISVVQVQANSPDFLSVRLDVFPLIDSATVYTVTITGGASDCPGNTLNNNTLSFGIGVAPVKNEIVIHEIFANPSNPIALPEQEFVELYNAGNRVLSLSGLKFSDAVSSSTISSGTLLPGAYLIICSNTAASYYKPYGYTIGLSNWPSLNNSGDNLSLRLPNGTLIHQVDYSDTWYGNAEKKNGGWTLEMIDPLNPCGEEQNWRASVNPAGGTPGKANSVYASNPDVTPPILLKADALNDTTVLLTFNERIDSLSAAQASYIISGFSITGISIAKKTVTLTLSAKLQIQILYTVLVGGLSDCSGNVIGAQNKADFALPEQASALDIVINEVLFNSRTGGSDFVEIYNRSTKNINLQNWQLANIANDAPANLKNVSALPFLLKPGEYLVLTNDTLNIKQEYPLAREGRFIQMPSLPAYNNSNGNVLLINNLGELCDRFDYDDKMHFALLKDKKGISLERIDVNRPTNERTNWHSAAETVGFATPGYENSQFQQGEGQGEVHTEPEIFSPDNDGYNDVLNIHYNFGEPGYVGSIYIYDNEGRVVRTLIQNELLASKGTYSWDGITDRYEKARIGIYIVYFEAFDLSGNTKRFKKVCVLGGFIGK